METSENHGLAGGNWSLSRHPLWQEQARAGAGRAISEAGLNGCENRLGRQRAWYLPSPNCRRKVPAWWSFPAHIDTVFPAETPLIPSWRAVWQRPALRNGAGIVGMLAIATQCARAGSICRCRSSSLACRRGGRGDLRGVRHSTPGSAGRPHRCPHRARWRRRRFRCDPGPGKPAISVTINGPGGHSFTDAGTANPSAPWQRALSTLAEVSLPEEPRTTLKLARSAAAQA